ncbi:MAG: NAD(P)(+) transhydrogenase (Re/Si-specific) subunit beta [Myxococcota bacterium]
MSTTAILLAYLVAAVLFIEGIRRLSSPKTASGGNAIAAVGMLVAIVATLVDRAVVSYGVIAASMAAGAAVGIYAAYTVKMTAMPQMVALFNGLGGGASSLVAAAELLRSVGAGSAPQVSIAIPIVLGVLIGAVTLTGSGVAFAKLQGLMRGSPIVFPLQQPFNIVLGLTLLGLSVFAVVEPSQLAAFWVLAALASLLGVLLVIPIGGADMPVVISLLNAYSGLAACATGFVFRNQVLIISGSLVGASGIILTQIMCRAMNRSLFNVVFSAFGQADESGTGAEVGGSVKSGSAEDSAAILDAARSVVIVPGYGLAVAQAQHTVKELASLLGERGIDVKYAIHPVAGRMPGHMNVLLAEADVPYEQLVEMEEINPQLPNTDVALVIGANDVTNPAAREDPSSPIYGMPIIDVDRCKTVIVIKRSLNPGFAGIANPLYTADNTMMFFGDAKRAVGDLVKELREL